MHLISIALSSQLFACFHKVFADKFAVICKSIVIQNLSQILSPNPPLITKYIKGNKKYLISGVLENFSLLPPLKMCGEPKGCVRSKSRAFREAFEAWAIAPEFSSTGYVPGFSHPLCDLSYILSQRAL